MMAVKQGKSRSLSSRTDKTVSAVFSADHKIEKRNGMGEPGKLK
jgi:hypothetical protein